MKQDRIFTQGKSTSASSGPKKYNPNPFQNDPDPGLSVYNRDCPDWDQMSEACHITECFIPEAEVLMGDGTTKEIKDVVVGDKVQGVHGINIVINTPTFNLGNQPLHGFNGRKPFVTSMHPIMTDKGWANFNPEIYKEQWPLDYIEISSFNESNEILKLNVGDNIAFWDGGINYESLTDYIEKEEHPNFKVYNLTLDNDHTFIVEGVVVHNKFLMTCNPANDGDDCQACCGGGMCTHQTTADCVARLSGVSQGVGVYCHVDFCESLDCWDCPDVEEDIYGCMDSDACNYDPLANQPDGCTYEVECCDGTWECEPENDCPYCCDGQPGSADLCGIYFPGCPEQDLMNPCCCPGYENGLWGCGGTGYNEGCCTSGNACNFGITEGNPGFIQDPDGGGYCGWLDCNGDCTCSGGNQGLPYGNSAPGLYCDTWTCTSWCSNTCTCCP